MCMHMCLCVYVYSMCVNVCLWTYNSVQICVWPHNVYSHRVCVDVYIMPCVCAGMPCKQRSQDLLLQRSLLAHSIDTL